MLWYHVVNKGFISCPSSPVSLPASEEEASAVSSPAPAPAPQGGTSHSGPSPFLAALCRLMRCLPSPLPFSGDSAAPAPAVDEPAALNESAEAVGG
jgi:hypothetical protein